MSTLLLVLNCPGHNTLGLGPPPGKSIWWWESEDGRCPHRDWLDVPDGMGDVG
jgi:hypothetical protein